MADEILARLASIEQRLLRLEKAVYPPDSMPRPISVPSAPTEPATSFARPESSPPITPRPVSARREQPASGRDDTTITSLLGWAGAVAFVLAAAYLIRLAIDAGWLTPTVQIACAALFGFVLIAVGFALRGANHRYAGLLPAAGVAILFLSVYGAHLLYHLTGAYVAGAAIIAVCAISLGLCLAFDSDLYALFAVVGSYSAPFLIEGPANSVADLALYYSAWSVTFTIFAIARGRRLIYLVALYAALIGFDALSRDGSMDWRTLLGFQSAQFAIFGVGTVMFSARHRAPMDESTALVHLPALLLFYALQYFVLKAHLPQAAPWIAVSTLAVVAALYLSARVVLNRPSPGGQLLLGTYAALVLLHAGYLESAPASAAPWIALLLVALALAARGAWGKARGALWPLGIAIAIIFLLNLLRIVSATNLNSVPAHQLLGFIYAAMLYGGYLLVNQEPSFEPFKGLLLYAGHVTAISAVIQLVHERILQSVVWGLLALACMLWSLARRDRTVGQSSLLLFAVTGVKVMLFDLSHATPLTRIISLVVLGVTFYSGGLLYQRIAREAGTPAAKAA
jgi:hypothetical protein